MLWTDYTRLGLIFGWPFVKRFALCYRTVVLSVLSFLSICNVTARQDRQDRVNLSSRLATTNTGRKLGGCAPLGEGELGPHFNTMRPWPRPNCMPSCILMHLAGWMDEDATWYGGRPRPRRHCVRWGLRSPTYNFGPCLMWPNGWMDQDVRWGPSPPKGHNPQFSAHICCGQTAGWIKMPLAREVDLGPGHIVLDEDPALPKGAQHPLFSAHDYCSQTVAHLSCCWALVSLPRGLCSVRLLVPKINAKSKWSASIIVRGQRRTTGK